MFDLNPQFPNNSRHTFVHDVRFGIDAMEKDSGVSLWERSISPQHSPVNPGALSPASRARAIAKGRREMMEMVENMPETSYELSLKDLVNKEETKSMEEGEERSILRDSPKKNYRQYEGSNKIRGGGMTMKNSSMKSNNEGLLINMLFPFSIGSKKKKTSIRNNSSSGIRFSPDQQLLDKSVVDRRDWWWKKFTDPFDSESLGITSSSTGSSGGSSVAGSLHSNSHRTKNNCGYGCWSFFPGRKKKSQT